MNMIYSVSCNKYKVGHKVCRTPPLYGIWQPDKYTVTVTDRLFSPLIVACSHGYQAADVPVYAYPKMILMECMFACLFFSAPKYKIRIQQKLGLLCGRCYPPMLASWNAGGLPGQAHVVYSLLSGCTPVLFLLGHLVRGCG